ncbi:MAG: hypothetical protein U0P45_09800 [Acidimicrobiales bacterium]
MADREEGAVFVDIREQHFATEAEAYAEIEARGWYPITLEFDVEDEELHWHDFSSVIYVLSGCLRAESADGHRVEVPAGARIEAPARLLHREVGSRHRSVVGLDVPVEALTAPINKPAADLPAS